MGKQLIIAEKPSVARDISKVLGCTQKGDGYLEGTEYVITWAIGHLVTLYEPEDYDDKLKKWQYQSLPILPDDIKIKPYDKTIKQLKIIKKQMDRKDIDSLICATDSGREGELIFRYIYSYAKCSKPFTRLWISSMTDKAILEGFSKLKDGNAYNALYLSAKCRSEADWLVGINATRAYTTQNNVLLSIGRVQTPTLALIVQRQKEIEDFVPKDYYELQGDFGDFVGTWFDEKPTETKIFDENKAIALSEKVLGKEGTIKKITKSKKKEMPPPLYDLTELQRDGNKSYGLTAQEVLTIAQNLYEKRKLITYPRTDSRYLSDDMKSKVKQTMNKINVPPFNKAIAPLLAKGDLKFTKRIIDNSKVTDHHAIIPTDVSPKLDSLSKDELNIYQLVVKRFIAVFYDDFLYETTEVIVDVEKEAFVAKGKIITQKGWKSLYIASKDDKEQELPPVQKGDKRMLEKTEILKKQTSPPKPFTEAMLLSAMENAGRYIEDETLKEHLKESGFGTPATRAGIIERLIQVEYIGRKGKALFPTSKGISLISIVPEELKSPETTGKWEKALHKISQGEMETDKFMDSIKRFVVYLVKSSEKNKGTVVFEDQRASKGKARTPYQGKTLGTCPICQKGSITENSKAFGCTQWRNGCKFTLWKNVLDQHGFTLTQETVTALIENFGQKEKGVLLENQEKRIQLSLDSKGMLQIDSIE